MIQHQCQLTNDLLTQLQQRGLIAQVTNLCGLQQRLQQGPITLYCGFDPTAESLHVGHLIPLLCLRWFQMAGHRTVLLLGGATGLVGDPSFKASERQLNDPARIKQWIEDLAQQLNAFPGFRGPHAPLLLNNRDWFQSMHLLHFLRDVGKHFSVNAMINKEAVRQRLSRNESGLSFTEFSYSLLQAYDFVYLNRHHGVELQIGGSDQWGNITAGIDLTRRLNQRTAYGLTVPLITQTDGIKFGKSEKGTVWLNSHKTSPYQFYQFWLRSKDADVYRFLSLFTFLLLEEIAALAVDDQQRSEAPHAQQILAREVTQMVHGKEGLEAAQRITKSLFSGDCSALTAADFAQLEQDGLPTVTLPASTTLQQALVSAQLAPSCSQARTLIKAGAVALNGRRCSDERYVLHSHDYLYNRYSLLKKGKRHYCLLCWD